MTTKMTHLPSKGLCRLTLLLSVCFLCAAIWSDGVTANFAEDFILYDSLSKWSLTLLLAAIGGSVQWLLQREQVGTWMTVTISAALVMFSEFVRPLGGKDHHMAAFLLFGLGGPLFLGAAAAVLLTWLSGKGQRAKLAAAVLALAVVCGAWFFWPRQVTERLDVDYDGTLLYWDGVSEEKSVTADQKAFLRGMEWAMTVPAFREQGWRSDRAFLARVSGEYVVVISRSDESGVYEYSGSLAEFDETKPKWTIFSDAALYQNLLVSTGNWPE